MIKNFLLQLGICISFIVGILFVLPLFKLSFAATLNFDQATVSTSVNQTFTITIIVDSKDEQINSSDVYVLYDQTYLTAQSVIPKSTTLDTFSDETFFPIILSNLQTAGRAYIAAMIDLPGTYKTGRGTIASIVFKALKNGTTDLTFDCTAGVTTDSNIVKNDVQSTDIIECGANGKAVITIGEVSGPTSTPAPTLAPGAPTSTPIPVPTSKPVPPAPTSTPIPVPTSTPVPPPSGIIENVVKYSVPGVILLIVGTGVRLLL